MTEPPAGSPRTPLLPPQLVAQLRRLRLKTARRVDGRYAGAHRARRYGTSLDYADHRPYIPGDDPRSLDVAASRRLRRLLVKLYEAEDAAAVRIVVDLSASMGFGHKAAAARQIAFALVAVASGGQDQVRLMVASDQLHTGPGLHGPSTLAMAEARLASVRPGGHDGDPAATLVTAVRRAVGGGPAGPVVLISDLLLAGWEQVVRALQGGRGDGALIHLLGRADLEPELHGDLRLVDSETGQELEAGEGVLADYAATRDRWLAEVAEVCGRHRIAYVRLTDDEPVADLLVTSLRRLGVVG